MKFTIKINPDGPHEVVETVPLKPGESVEVRVTPANRNHEPKTLTGSLRRLFGMRGDDG